MITREEKNKEYVDEINKEKAINISKKILHIVGIIFFTVFLIFSYIYFLGVKGLKINEYVVKDNNIPESFHGVKILHFTDILYGSTIFQNDIEKLEEKIKLINPNIVLFTGNIIAPEYKISEDEIKMLNNFFESIPYTIGKYAVKGNYDASTYNLIFENTKFDVLDNDILKIYNNSNELINIVGLFKDDGNLLLDNNQYTIALINNYDDYHKFNINANLVCAGHNLGGEIRFFGYPLLGDSKYNNLYYEENNSKVYISNGLGSIHHIRFMNHPSINVYRLYKK